MTKDSPSEKSISVITKRNKAQSFESFRSDIWNFQINAYQICRTWFKARNSRPLDNQDTQHYQRIVTFLNEIVKLAEEIETVFYYNQLKKLEIFEKVRTIITEKLEIEPDQITPMANFSADFGADSLDNLELVIALEKTFEIQITAQTAQRLTTVKQVIDHICRVSN